MSGPRIYDLFPLLVGPVREWRAHVPRIQAMGFDWIYVNAFHCPGFSGSLYAIKDPYRLNDLFADGGGDHDASLGAFIELAGHHGIGVMMDVVINHTARDARLVEEHPDWYRRDLDGDLLRPAAVDPDDPARVTVWGDLAALDYDNAAARAGLIDHWSRYLRHYLGLGFRGFRCDAAYMVPVEVWRELVQAARTAAPDAFFLAETLGCSAERVEALGGAGFDFLFNSSKWWDFRADWLLDQYQRLRRLAPSVAFPESHDTPRLAAEVVGDDRDAVLRRLKFRYLFAACFSTGVMMPIGYEHGFRQPLDVVRTRPSDWEETGIDISDFIAAVNAMKAAIPALNEEGPQRRITAPHAAVVGLFRETADRAGGGVLTLVNPDPDNDRVTDAGALVAATGGVFDRFDDVTPQASPILLDPGAPLELGPSEVRVFRCERAARRAAAGTAETKAGRRRLDGLAAARITIEDVWPEIDGGRHPVKRVVGDVIEVWADIFGDGHDAVAAAVLYREERQRAWREAPMAFVDNDRWSGRVPLTRNTRYRYTIEAWRDLFATWRLDFVKKRDAGHAVSLELIEGRGLVAAAAGEAKGPDAETVAAILARLDRHADDEAAVAEILLSETVGEVMARAAPRVNATRYRHELEVIVDRTAARFGAWYEMFPRSAAGDAARHGTFDDVIARLPYVRDLGFDVLYFPPIHPIGRTHRKGRNNTLATQPGDPGSPYATGSAEGGHTAIHPELGTFDDFRRLIEAARREGIEIALDFAIQCSPDHPWIKEHPEWFDWRPDGTIRYAENPPKKYQDIVNVHFYRQAVPGIWYALRDVVLFWIGAGVTIFRVDNPHTKPVPFWEWLIREVQDRHPETIFLSEAFTRPKMMKKLAKAGFTQSYTYFTWRNHKAEIVEYLTELTRHPPKEYFRPNFFVNTPDINPKILQTGGRAAFRMRAALAATLSSLWGMYSGFELCEGTPIPGTEEYLNAEKYEIKAWDWDRPGNIRDYVARLNRIRRDNPALHDFANLRFHPAHDDGVLFYAKATAALDNILWIAVNLDPHRVREADLELPFHEVGLGDGDEVEVEELLSGVRDRWRGRGRRVRLDPEVNPCAIWRVTPPAGLGAPVGVSR